MTIAFLGPFLTKHLQPYLPGLSNDDVRRAPGMGGYGLIQLVLERLRRKQSTVIITLDPGLVGEMLVRRAGCLTLYVLPRRRTHAMRDQYTEERRLIGEAIGATHPDVVHANWTYEYALAALQAPGRTPTVVTVRDHVFHMLAYLGPKYLVNFLVTMRTYKHARFFTAVSPYIQELVERFGRDRVWMIPNAVDPSLFALPIPSAQPSAPVIVTTTQWNRLKNPKVALQAFRLVRARYGGAELHMCGGGMEPDGPAARWARIKGLDGGVVFRGKLEHEQVIDSLRQCSLYLHTSLSEACNTAVAEATSLGIPVVGGRSSGAVPWQLDDGRAGVLTNVRDPEDVAKCIIAVIEDSQGRDSLATRARSYASKLYTASLCADRYDEVYSLIRGAL